MGVHSSDWCFGLLGDTGSESILRFIIDVRISAHALVVVCRSLQGATCATPVAISWPRVDRVDRVRLAIHVRRRDRIVTRRRNVPIGVDVGRS